MWNENHGCSLELCIGPKELLLYAYEKSLFQLRARVELLGVDVEIVVCHEQGQWNYY